MSAKLSAKSVITASTGMKLPIIGLGTFLSSDEALLEKALNCALEDGYRLIDTAFLYQNEAVIGRVLKQWFESGKLKRKDVFITTKLPPQGNNPKHAREFLVKSLTALQLDYVDLYLVHHAVGWKYGQDFVVGEGEGENKSMELDLSTDHVAVWKEMEKAVDDKLAKYIGLSNFNTKQIERVMKNARIPPSNLQIEMYLYLQSKEEQEFCKKHGITITSYATMGSPGVPNGLFAGANMNPMKDPVVECIAAAHKKSPAQILLRHVLQLGVAIIPKSVTPDRLKQNINVFDFELTQAEMAQLEKLDRGEEGRRFILPGNQSHPESPYPKRV